MRECVLCNGDRTCVLIAPCNPLVDTVKLRPITGLYSDCRQRAETPHKHTCKLIQGDMSPWMSEVLIAGVYSSTFFMWIWNVMLNTFAPESSILMLLNISFSNRMGKAKRGRSLREETEGVQNAANTTQWVEEEAEGGTQVVRNRGTKEETKAKKKKWRHRAAKGWRVKERKEGTRESVWCQVCSLLSVKPCEEPSCIMQLHVTERWGLGQTMEADHIIQSCQSLLSESCWCAKKKTALCCWWRHIFKNRCWMRSKPHCVWAF